jgi:hypothetical protein
METRDEIKKAKFNIIKFEQLIYAKVQSFGLNPLFNNSIISCISSIPILGNRPYFSFNVDYDMVCRGASFE